MSTRTVNFLTVIFFSVGTASSFSGSTPRSTPLTVADGTRATAHFTTPPMQVFIEDTDAYGVMYNANYLRCYDRALHMVTFGSDEAEFLGAHDGWSIVSVGQQKFSSSPAMGGMFVIEGTRVEASSDSETWDMAMKSPDGDTTYNTVANLQIARPDEEHSFEALPLLVDPLDFSPKETAVSCNFLTFRDEFDPQLQDRLPLRNVLNFFERIRSNFLGGPDGLRRLQEDGLVAVVTRIEDCCLLLDTTCKPGQELTVQTVFQLKRRGMVVECFQILRNGTNALAQGKVTVMFLDGATRRPTAKLPEWLRDIMDLDK